MLADLRYRLHLAKIRRFNRWWTRRMRAHYRTHRLPGGES